MTVLDPIAYPDAKLRRILSTVRTIAILINIYYLHCING